MVIPQNCSLTWTQLWKVPTCFQYHLTLPHDLQIYLGPSASPSRRGRQEAQQCVPGSWNAWITEKGIWKNDNGESKKAMNKTDNVYIYIYAYIIYIHVFFSSWQKGSFSISILAIEVLCLLTEMNCLLHRMKRCLNKNEGFLQQITLQSKEKNNSMCHQLASLNPLLKSAKLRTDLNIGRWNICNDLKPLPRGIRKCLVHGS